MAVIDTESVDGDLDSYTVSWWVDEFADNPFDDYDHVTSLVLRPLGRGCGGFSYGPMGDEVARVIAAGERSEASILRWLALRGCCGIHTLYRSGQDGRIVAAVPFRPDTETDGAALEGVAFVVADRLSDVTDPDAVVRAEVQELSYWSQRDVFGYSITRRGGDLIGSAGGFFGWSESRDVVLRENITDHITEHESLLAAQARLAGAGFLGVV